MAEDQRQRQPVESGILELSNTQLRKIIGRVKRHSRIQLDSSKRELVRSRLAKQLRKRKIHSFQNYIEKLEAERGIGELSQELINAISTNKTSFFREDSSLQTFLQRSLATFPDTGSFRLLIAGCSTGQEAYSLAMLAYEALGEAAAQRVVIDAWDINSDVIATAKRGVYPIAELDDIPYFYRKRYLLRGVGKNEATFRVDAKLRKLVRFHQLNLFEHALIPDAFHGISCRYVMIYFTAIDRIQLLNSFRRALKLNGLLLIGRSETLLDGFQKQQIKRPAGFAFQEPTLYKATADRDDHSGS